MLNGYPPEYAHYEQVRITLYIFTDNFDFKSKSKQSTKLLFQYKISRFSWILSLHFPPFRTLYGFSKLLHKCVILTTNRNNLHQKPGKPFQKSKYFQANRHFLISMLNPEHLTNFKNLKTQHTNKTLNKTELINKKQQISNSIAPRTAN